MNYLIERFIRKLKDYRFLKFYYKIYNEFTEIFIYDPPAELDVELVNASYTETIKFGYAKDESNKLGYKLNSETETTMCCTPIMEADGTRTIKIVLTKETYAKKLNVIDTVLKRYNEKINK